MTNTGTSVQIGGKELANLRKKLVDPTRNHRLRVAKLRPQEHYCVVRVDPPKTQTDGGLLLLELAKGSPTSSPARRSVATRRASSST